MATNYLPGPYREFLIAVETPRRRAEDARLRLALARPEWLQSMDARLTMLSSVCNVLRAAEMALVVLEVHMGNADWWRALKGPTPNIKDIAFDYTAFSQNGKDSLLVFGLGAIENGFRCILRALDPSAASFATKEFKSIYECLFKKLQFPEQTREGFDLARLLRNTIHNEGVHLPPAQNSPLVHWKGDDYAFVSGAPIEFATWGFIIRVLDDLTATAIQVVEHPDVTGYTQHIPDPGAFAYEGAG